MGKKEKKIKQLNSEFYKIYNSVNTPKIYTETREEILDRIHEEKIEQEERKFDNVVKQINDELLEYVDQQGLSLLENKTLFIINLHNYIDFCTQNASNIKSKTLSNTKETRDQLEQEQDEEPSYLENNEEISEEELTQLRKNTIIKLGEFEIFKDYITHNIKKKERGEALLDEKNITNKLRNELIKIAGTEEYYKHVNILGEYEYKLIEERLENK